MVLAFINLYYTISQVKNGVSYEHGNVEYECCFGPQVHLFDILDYLVSTARVIIALQLNYLHLKHEVVK